METYTFNSVLQLFFIALFQKANLIIMVNVPKMRRTYCPHPDCMSHKQFKVVQYKKSAESKQAQGRRR